MKDFKILSFSTCTTDTRCRPTVVKQGVNTFLEELTELEAMLAPYLNDGYKITQFSASSSMNIVVVLEKD